MFKRLSAGLVLLAAVGFFQPALAVEESYKQVEKLLSTKVTNQNQPIIYPETGPADVTAVIVTLQPGESTKRHLHNVPLFAYLLEGELTVAYEGHETKHYKTGDALIEAHEIWHQGINSGTGPVRILAVFMGADGTQSTIFAK